MINFGHLEFKLIIIFIQDECPFYHSILYQSIFPYNYVKLSYNQNKIIKITAVEVELANINFIFNVLLKIETFLNQNNRIIKNSKSSWVSISEFMIN